MLRKNVERYTVHVYKSAETKNNSRKNIDLNLLLRKIIRENFYNSEINYYIYNVISFRV